MGGGGVFERAGLCVRAYVRACVCMCVCARAGTCMRACVCCLPSYSQISLSVACTVNAENRYPFFFFFLKQ